MLACLECPYSQLRKAAQHIERCHSPLLLHSMAAQSGQPRYLCNFAVEILQVDDSESPLYSTEHAMDLFREAASAGSSAAACNLGACYEHGSCVPVDWQKSLHWYEVAVQLGDSGAAADAARLQQLLAGSSGDGSPEALFQLGQQFWSAKDEADSDKMDFCLKALVSCAQQGRSDAAFAAALALEASDDFRLAETGALRMQLLLQAASDGVEGAALVYATALESFADDDSCFAQAARWYRTAAETGDLDAMFRLAVLLEDSPAISATMGEQAVVWYTRAAEEGHSSAQLCLGVLAEQGELVRRDIHTALGWYTLAAEQGSAVAAFNIGRLYEAGSLGDVDEATALEWYMQAGNAGDAQGSFRVYELCRFQADSPQHHEMATAWLHQAADQGSDEAHTAMRLNELLSQQAPCSDTAGDSTDSSTAAATLQSVTTQPTPSVHNQQQQQAAGTARLMRRMSLSKSLSRQQWDELHSCAPAAADPGAHKDPAPIEASREVAQVTSVCGPEDAAGRDFKLAHAAAAEGDTQAQAAVAAMYYAGLDIARDLIAARAWATRAAEAGETSAQHQLAQQLLAGEGCKQSQRKAIAWLEKAVAAKHIKSHVTLACICLESGVSGDAARAKLLLEAAAAAGSADASHRLGTLLMQDVAKGQADASEAVKRVREAAEQGSADAMCDLAMMYLQGVGVPQDALSAKEWLKEAANAGSSSAQNNLGLLYAFGSSLLPHSGLKLNAEKAYRSFRAAADAGEAGAQFNLGMMYVEGKTIDQDNKRGTKWLKRAAAQDYPDALLQLRNMYMAGEGVKRSRSKAAGFQQRLTELAQRLPHVADMLSSGASVEPADSAPVEQEDPTLVAAAAGDPEALYVLSQQALERSKQAQVSGEARELLEMAAAAGHAQASEQLAELQRDELLRRAATRAEAPKLSAAQKRHEFLKRAAAGK